MPDKSPAPLIGITTSRTFSRYGFPVISLTEAYVQAVQRAGGLPLLIPLGLEAPALEALLPRLDGILFSGGGDVHPHHYGSQVHPLVDGVDEDRDRIELSLVRSATDHGLPFLGICRGLQVVNVALGGTLYEDLRQQHTGALEHDCFPTFGRDYLAHPVEIEPASRLGAILQLGSTRVNSLHHQGVRDLAPGLRCTAQAPDGVVEAYELPGHPFGLAVQWHPEWLPGQLAMRALFEAFVQAAAGLPDGPQP